MKAGWLPNPVGPATPGVVPAGARMPCLDGLRGLAAVMVVFSHAPEFGFAGVIAPLSGAYGVLIFFGLSGFLMGELYLSRQPTPGAIKGFVAARIARIAPIYYIVVVASFLLCTFVWPDFVYRFPPLQLVRLLTFNGSASVFWSISPEVQFYFVFIPLWLLHARLGHDLAFTAIVGGLAILAMLTITLWPGILVVSKFHIFACGMLAAVGRRHVAPYVGPVTALVLHAASLATLVALLVPGNAEALFGDPHAGHVNDPTFAAFYGNPGRCLLAGALAFSLSFDGPLGAALFANPLAALLGRCSFSIYLLHAVVFFAAARLGLPGLASPVVGTAVVLGVTIAVAAASYRWIEAPARIRARRILLASMEPGRSLPRSRTA